MALHWVLGTTAVLVAVAFVVGRLAAAVLTRSRDPDRSRAGRVQRLTALVLVPHGGLLVGLLLLPETAPEWTAVHLPTAGWPASVLYGLAVGVASTAVAGGVARGFRPLRAAVVDDSGLTRGYRDRLRWWLARLVPYAVAATAPILLVRQWYPLGLAGVLLTWILCRVVAQFLRRPQFTAERVRDPTPEERDRIEAVLGDQGPRPDRIAIREGGSEWPVGWVRRWSSQVLHVDESLLAADDDRLGVALTQAAVAGRRHLGLLQLLTSTFAVTGALLSLTILGRALFVRDPSGPAAALYDPVTLTIGVLGAITTAYVFARAGRATVYAADAVAAERYGVDAVESVLDTYGTAIPVEQLTTGNFAEGGVNLPTVGQRQRVVSTAGSEEGLPATVTGSRPAAPDATASPARFLGAETARIAVGWLLFALAAAVHRYEPGTAVASGDAAVALIGGAVTVPIFVAGYVVVSADHPVINMPFTPGEYPQHPRERQFKRLVDPAVLAVLVLVAALVAAGVAFVHWLLVTPVLLVTAIQLVSTVPIVIPRESMRAPTTSERATVRSAYESFDGRPDAVVVYEPGDRGELFTVHGLGTRTVYVGESLLDRLDESDLAAALAHADHRARSYWYQRGTVLPLLVLETGLVAASALFQPQLPALLTEVAVLTVLLCVPIALLALRLGRSPVYDADAYAASVFGPDPVRDVYERHGDALRQLKLRTDVGPGEEGLFVRLLSQEPPLHRRLDRLSDGD